LRKSEGITISGNQSLDELMSEFERQVIVTSLEQNRYNISKTAEQLKISRHALRYRMQRLSISIGTEDDTPPPPAAKERMPGRVSCPGQRRFVMTDQSRTITRKSASNLALAFVLLPKAKRHAMSALYAFCREVDDVADEETVPLEKRRADLAAWREDVRLACERRRSVLPGQPGTASGHRAIPPAVQSL
jgi:predicted ArsR family transcriptional regulator